MTDARPEQAWFAKADNDLQMARRALPASFIRTQHTPRAVWNIKKNSHSNYKLICRKER